MRARRREAMDADGSAERRESACVGADVTRADKQRRMNTAAACDRRRNGYVRPRYGRRTDASRLQRPGERTTKEETMEEWRVERRKEMEERETQRELVML